MGWPTPCMLIFSYLVLSAHRQSKAVTCGIFHRILSIFLHYLDAQLGKLENATGWMKGPGDRWISRENRIPKYLSADYDILQDYERHSLGVYNLLFAPLGRELDGFSEWVFKVDPFIIAGELEQPQNIRRDIMRQMALYMVIIGQIDNLDRVEHIQQYTGCWAV